MHPEQLQALAIEHARDRERGIAVRITPFGEEPRIRRTHRVGVRCGYWLISVGCRLVAPDLPAAAH
jgi:hypothetical protein